MNKNKQIVTVRCQYKGKLKKDAAEWRFTKKNQTDHSRAVVSVRWTFLSISCTVFYWYGLNTFWQTKICVWCTACEWTNAMSDSLAYSPYVPLLNGDVVGHLVHHLIESLAFNLIQHRMQHFHQPSKLHNQRHFHSRQLQLYH